MKFTIFYRPFGTKGKVLKMTIEGHTLKQAKKRFKRQTRQDFPNTVIVGVFEEGEL